jgi:phospholipid transport system substrate-binding protein
MDRLMHRRQGSGMHWITRFLIVLVVALGAQRPATAQADVDAARAFVADLGHTAIEMLTSSGLSQAERAARFKELLSTNFDVPRIGNFVLGQYRRQATQEELNSFYEVFKDTMVATYIGRFDELSTNGFTVERAIPDGDTGVIVTTSVRDTSGQTARVDWRLRPAGSGFVVIDVAVEGVSIAQTLREEYASVIRQNGGTVSGLVNALRARLG